jgi:hypothetical protein
MLLVRKELPLVLLPKLIDLAQFSVVKGMVKFERIVVVKASLSVEAVHEPSAIINHLLVVKV